MSCSCCAKRCGHWTCGSKSTRAKPPATATIQQPHQIITCPQSIETKSPQHDDLIHVNRCRIEPTQCDILMSEFGTDAAAAAQFPCATVVWGSPLHSSCAEGHNCIHLECLLYVLDIQHRRCPPIAHSLKSSRYHVLLEVKLVNLTIVQ